MKPFIQLVCSFIYAWLKKVLAIFSQCVNALLLNGRPNQTVSSRAHSESSTSRVWRVTERGLNLVFWFDKDHCANSFLRERIQK
jgi:hypothetical protein